jgi:hypothetical protein
MLSFFKMSHNVSHIPEGGDYEAQNYQLTQIFNRSTKLEHITNTPLLGICCYVLGGLSALNLI